MERDKYFQKKIVLAWRNFKTSVLGFIENTDLMELLFTTFRSVSHFTHWHTGCVDILVALWILNTVVEPNVVKVTLYNWPYLKGLPFEFLLQSHFVTCKVGTSGECQQCHPRRSQPSQLCTKCYYVIDPIIRLCAMVCQSGPLSQFSGCYVWPPLDCSQLCDWV